MLAIIHSEWLLGAGNKVRPCEEHKNEKELTITINKAEKMSLLGISKDRPYDGPQEQPWGSLAGPMESSGKGGHR